METRLSYPRFTELSVIWEKKPDPFSPLRFETKSEFGHETSKLNPYSSRVS